MSDPGAGLGGMGMGAGPGQDPDALLQQIRQLLDQYLAMGDQTPVAPEAQQLADAIDEAQQGGGPEMGDLAEEGGPPPGEEEPDNLEEPPPSDSKTFAGANQNATERLKRRNKKGAKAY